jgi:hypothetical protein
MRKSATREKRKIGRSEERAERERVDRRFAIEATKRASSETEICGMTVRREALVHNTKPPVFRVENGWFA